MGLEGDAWRSLRPNQQFLASRYQNQVLRSTAGPWGTSAPSAVRRDDALVHPWEEI